jgi:hypothetical protein
MTTPARFKQSDLERAMRAAKKCGYEDVRVKIDASGQIEVIVGKAANDHLPPVELD